MEVITRKGATIAERDPAFDIVKGLSVLEVVAHHTLGISLKRFAEYKTIEWWVLFVLHKVLHFAVPAFLMMSALLLARSLARQGTPNWTRFYARRAIRTVWPYLLWSVFYLCLRFVAHPQGDWPHWQNWHIYLFWGKAYYHLYFFTVLVQVSLVFPALYYFTKSRNWTFGHWIFVAFALQLVVFYSNYFVAYVQSSNTGYLPFPASTVLWYLPPVILGAVIGLRWNEWNDIWTAWRWWFGGLAAFGLATYLYFEIYVRLFEIKIEVTNFESRIYNVSLLAYATSVALLLLGFSRTVACWNKFGENIAAIGNRSLGIFVIHPVILLFATQTQFIKLFNYTPLPYFWLWLIAFVGSWLIVEIAYVLRLGLILFGR